MGGFTYLGLLFVVVLLGLAASAASAVWSMAQKRENERQLLFVGIQFKAAIERWRQLGAAGNAYPTNLGQLLRDPRMPGTVRHLRKLYVDPMTGKAEWGLLRNAEGGIVGVFSLSTGQPIQRANFPAGISFSAARRYRDWTFIADGAERAKPDSLEQKGVEPEEAVEPAEESLPSPSSIAEDLRVQSSEACARIQALDQRICKSQRVRLGNQAGDECDESAAGRARACGSGAGLPALYIKTN